MNQETNITFEKNKYLYTQEEDRCQEEYYIIDDDDDDDDLDLQIDPPLHKPN